MRFILIYKYGILQTKTERIDVNFCQTTNQLLQYLSKRVGQSSDTFIAKVKVGKINYRIVSGWPISHYRIRQGMTINLELLEEVKNQKKSTNNQHINNRYLNNILGIKQKEDMTEIQQQVENQSEGQQNFNVRKYLDSECEKMLKQIQKKNTQSFLQIFQDYPENNVEEEALIQIQQKKPYIIDELGLSGWGAIHYAIFCKAYQIFDELLEMEADVNKCTSDGWLPIQLAINIKDRQFIQKLLMQPTINLNLITSKGSPLHMAAKQGNKEVIAILLEKEVEINLKDQMGKTALDVCNDEKCKDILRNYDDKKQHYTQYVNGSIPLSLATIIRGSILKAKRPFMNLKERYLLIDPFQGSMIRYQNQKSYPKKSIEVTPLSSLKGMKIVEKQDMAFYMKKEYCYFQIEQPNNELYACKHKQTAQKWLVNIKKAIKFAQQLEKNSSKISQIKKNELILKDEQQKIQPAPKKMKKNMYHMSLLSRNSVSTVKSDHSNHHTVTTNGQSNKQEKSEGNNHKKQQQGNNTANNSLEEKKNEVKREKEKLTGELNDITTNSVNFSSFNILSTLGSGAFGKVFLAKLISNGKLYALKALKKKNLILQKQLKYAIIEANILKQANNEFIINLHFAFQTPHYLYLALDYCSGRDLSFHLARQVTFPQSQAKFYTAELCLAIEHLHQKNIIYRDLKPQNILLDGSGHIKLADFGLSKQTNDDKTKSFCGSPAYLSPEMLTQKGAGKQSDLYGIGAVLYEFLIGQPPYFSDDIPTLYKNIKEGKLKFPKNVSQNARNFISGLLQRDPRKRLGAKNWSHIKEHPFFADIDWNKLVKAEIKTPIRPQIEQDDDDDDELDIIKNKNNTNFTDFDYDQSTKKINRLLNFSFARS